MENNNNSNENRQKKQKNLKKENLKWKASLVEAQEGLNPKIIMATKALKSKKRDQKTIGTSDLAATSSSSITTTATATTVAAATENSTAPASGVENFVGITKSPQLLQLRLQIFDRKFFHCQKELQKAFKKSKTFEVQKVIKRLRQAREPKEGVSEDKRNQECKELELQLSTLKQIKPETMTPIGLNLLKEKIYTGIPSVRDHINSAASTTKYGATMDSLGGINNIEKNLRQRLLNSKAVQETIKTQKSLLTSIFQDATEVEKPKPPSKPSNTTNNLNNYNLGKKDRQNQEIENKLIEASKKRQREEGEASSDESDSDSEGFFIGGGRANGNVSLSDEESNDNDSDREGLKKKKKNRKGQRARRLENEKVYGKDARHKRVKLESKELFNNKSTSKKEKSVSSNTKSEKEKELLAEKMRRKQVMEAANLASMHPSWAAKRQQAKASSNINAFEGSRITFDDDD